MLNPLEPLERFQSRGNVSINPKVFYILQFHTRDRVQPLATAIDLCLKRMLSAEHLLLVPYIKDLGDTSDLLLAVVDFWYDKLDQGTVQYRLSVSFHPEEGIFYSPSSPFRRCNAW